ncbi:MAG TPA: hypothetical protein VFD03_10170, partial [Clostridia bacterium]|nr:hypothetical protein [Clostridia bacterium]
YKVMDINSIIENGLIVMKMEWTAEQPEIIPVPEPIQPIIIDGETSITKGYAKTYTVDNSEIGEVVFSIIGNSASIQSQNGVAGTCTVLAGDVLGNVRLWCKTIDGLVEGYKDIRVRSIF